MKRMQFEYTKPSISRVRGKPFKLFSDELPRISLNRSYLDESTHGNKNGPNERQFPLPSRRRTPGDFHDDRFSLPSLGTPEWDRLSASPERPRPFSQSPEQSIHTNLSRASRSIRRRHGIREKGHIIEHFDPTIIRPSRVEEYTDMTETKPFELATKRTQLSTIGETNNENVYKNPTETAAKVKETNKKPKSILKQLLEASAIDNAKAKEIEDRFKPIKRTKSHIHTRPVNGTQHKETPIYRREGSQGIIHSNGQTMKLVPGQLKTYIENQPDRNQYNTVSSDSKILDSKNSREESHSFNGMVNEKGEDNSKQSKPGILKRNVLVHDARPPRHRDSLTRPRLVHQEVKTNDDVVYTDVGFSIAMETPIGQINKFLTIPLTPENDKCKTKRRVNFVEEVNKMSNDGVGFNADDLVNGTQKATSDKIDIKTNDNGKTDDLNIEPAKKKTLNRKVRRSRTTINRTSNGVLEKSNDDSNKATGKLRTEFSSFRQKREPKDELGFTANKVHVNNNEPDVLSVWKDMTKPLPDIVKVNRTNNKSHENTDLLETRGNTRLTSAESRRFQINSEIVANVIQDTGEDVDIFADIEAFYDELDVDAFGNVIDRRMIGEDLIKAYRLWDRQRKAFPGGLRKIEAPIERHSVLYPLGYGQMKPYKTQDHKQEMKTYMI